MNEVFRRITSFQPSTWFVHLLVAWAVWACIDILPKWAVVCLLVLAVLAYAYREWLNYWSHQAKGHNMTVWIADGVGDLIGPLTVLWAALGDPWVAHSFGLGIMGMGTIAWVGLGYSHYGGDNA